MSGVRDTFAISVLRQRRARIAGEIEATERRMAPQREMLAKIDAALQVFQPGVDPGLIRSIIPCGGAFISSAASNGDYAWRPCARPKGS
jgi:hypothetical protein